LPSSPPAVALATAAIDQPRPASARKLLCRQLVNEALHEAVVGPHIHPEGEVGSGFQRHPLLPQSSSASRFTAGAFGFLNLSQSYERPET
jgi:hypothetical protein